MRICIIGWYGTETIGDRAILAGILGILSQCFSQFDVKLGSLIPFFSERMVREDTGLWESLVGREVRVELFDSTRVPILKDAIKASDLVLVGGGPLMDLRSMHMLSFAVAFAKKKGKKTGIFGCGVGPLKTKEYRRVTADILSNIDMAVFRDSLSVEFLRVNKICDVSHYHSAIDPAAYCAVMHKKQYIQTNEGKKREICVNLRRMPSGYLDANVEQIDKILGRLIVSIAERFPDVDIVLTPNHYFAMGGDDRVFMNQIKFSAKLYNLRVQNQPLTLVQTMERFVSSLFCVGMRYHSFLMMALLNGRCIVLNYTGESEGKTAGFLKDFDKDRFFDTRHAIFLNRASDIGAISFFEDSDEFFSLNRELFDESISVYKHVFGEENL